jgi:hypothetical protein
LLRRKRSRFPHKRPVWNEPGTGAGLLALEVYSAVVGSMTAHTRETLSDLTLSIHAETAEIIVVLIEWVSLTLVGDCHQHS